MSELEKALRELVEKWRGERAADYCSETPMPKVAVGFEAGLRICALELEALLSRPASEPLSDVRRLFLCLEEIRQVASGQVQIGEDGMAWINKRAQKELAKPLNGERSGKGEQ